MFSYIVRRFLYAIPILLGVNLITFVLFFIVNTPDDMARINLGDKYTSQQVKDNWKKAHDYHLPLFFNEEEQGTERFTETIFYKKSVPLFYFDFGQSDAGRDIGYDITQRMGASLSIAIPSLILTVLSNIFLAFLLVFYRYTRLENVGLMTTVILMSISGLFYIILGQLIFAVFLKYVPISGYQSGWDAWRFVLLPVLISVVASWGSSTRWYRSIFLEEIAKDYVKVAYAKGLSDMMVLSKHVLKNALLPILTSIVAILPMLFMGSFILESFFSIPGLGDYTINAINAQDFAIVRAMVFLASVLYIVGLILTDISYTMADPRVKLGSK